MLEREVHIRVTLSTAGADSCQLAFSLQVCHACAICFEFKPDVKALPHAFPVGDVSEHVMCASCRQQWPSGCPFCRGVEFPPPPLGFVGFYNANSVSTNFSVVDAVDASAAVDAAVDASAVDDSAVVASAVAPPALEDGSTSDRRGSSILRLGAAFLPRIRRSVSGAFRQRKSASRQPQTRAPCTGCRWGCQECDPHGLKIEMNPFMDPFVYRDEDW